MTEKEEVDTQEEEAMSDTWFVRTGSAVYMDGRGDDFLGRRGKPGSIGPVLMTRDVADSLADALGGTVDGVEPQVPTPRPTGHARNEGDMARWRAESTAAAMDPRVGDRYQEMYSVWLYVTRVADGEVSWLLGHSFPHGAKARDGSRQDFVDFIRDNGMLLEDRGNDVAATWYERTHPVEAPHE